MGATLADLDQRQVARLRAELCEVIAARFAYPPFFDFRGGRARMRPVGAAKRSEIASFVGAVELGPLDHATVDSPEVRRFLERLFLHYLETNHDLARRAGHRHLSALRVDAARAAAETQRGLVALSAGAPGDYGTPRPANSWASPGGRSRQGEPDWKRVERATRMLQTALLGHPGEATSLHLPAVRPGADERGSPRSAPPTRGAGSSPADSAAAQGASNSHSPFSGLEGGSQSPIFGVRPGLPERFTGPQPTQERPAVPPQAPAASRELPADLFRVYSMYLRAIQPEAEPPPPPPTPRPPAEWPAPPPSPHARTIQHRQQADWSGWGTFGIPAEEGDRVDRMIFSQLSYQLEAFVRRAAQSYGVRARGEDPAAVLDALRRSGHVDEADLRIAENILAIADRIAAEGGATKDDFRQAMMLYLLYHRSRMGA